MPTKTATSAGVDSAVAKPKPTAAAKAGATARKAVAPAGKPRPNTATAPRAATKKLVAKKPAAKKIPAKTSAGDVKPKAKLVRDSFTMPKSDFDLVGVLKERALGFKRPAKKSELLRAGLHALSSLNDSTLQAALNALTPIKPGRPKNPA